MPALRLGDPNAITEWQELMGQGNSRHQLHKEILEDLEKIGVLIDTESVTSATFMAKSFTAYIMRTLVGRGDPSDQPEAVSISVFAAGRSRMRTVFRGRGARVLSADKRLLQRDKDRFLEHYHRFLDHRLRRASEVETEQPAGQGGAQELVFENAEQISNFILSQFTSLDIKRYLQNAPRRSTVLFIVDEAHTDMPWELMLEATYAGEIPFRVGRTVVSKLAPQCVRPPLRGIRRIRPLLIGNPSGDLEAAAEEVQELAKIFAERPTLFEAPEVLTTEEQCHSVRLLSALSSGQYDLVHYAGHARHMGSDSAWQASDGEITTDRLTNALEMAPPALAFVSACESAEGAAGGLGQYEGQSFDLPGAFLQAGVEVYIGALWRVDSANSCDFARAFYGEFVRGEHELGECMRRAKWERKKVEEGGLDWLSFVLYGDPRLTPGDLFPVMADAEQEPS
ncbi:MAG: CHAT domain-containing protein [Anaerolineae bacterium]|nr:CHAT domain-containing protein [Anaerolineae bacterium]